MFWLSSNFKHSGWLPTSVSTCCIDLYYSNSQTELVMVLPSGNFERFGWAADSSEQLLHRSRLIVFDDPNADSFDYRAPSSASGWRPTLVRNLRLRSWLMSYADSIVHGFTYYRTTSSVSGWKPTSVSTWCIHLYLSNSQTELFMVLLSDNCKRVGSAADFNEHLLHWPRLIVLADPKVDVFTIGQLQAFWADGRP